MRDVDFDDPESVAAFLEAQTTEDCVDCFAQYLIELKRERVLSAKQACILAYWAHRSGIDGMTRKLAFAPGKASVGHYSRHWDAALHEAEGDEHYMKLRIPLTNRSDFSRTLADVPVVPPHVGLSEELHMNPDIKLRCQDNEFVRSLPRIYHEHPAVRTARPSEPVLALSLYVDGVQFSRTDSVIGFFCYNIASGIRHLCATLRKSELCSCGCRGWCSIFPILAMLRWSVVAMLSGRHPDAMPCGSDWDDEHVIEKSFAGQRLGWTGAVLFMKADWSENVTTMGMPSWSAEDNCCPMCRCSRHDWDQFQGLSPNSVPWAEKTTQDFENACIDCEFFRDVTDADFPSLRGTMFFDRRKHGNRGRCMSEDFPRMNLVKGDRLEPHLAMQHTMAFDMLPRPFRVKFWRPSNETLCRHRNPLISDECKLGPRNMVVDWLHCLSLGVFPYFINFFVHWLMSGNAFGVAGTTVEERRSATIQRFKAILFQWYSSEDRLGRARHRVQNLTEGMFGETERDLVSLHGAEANDVLIFCVECVLPRFCTDLENYKYFKISGEALCAMLSLIRRSYAEWNSNFAKDLRG